MAELALGITAQLIAVQVDLRVVFCSPLPALGQKLHLMAASLGEVAAEMAELGWVVAVNK